MAANPLLLSEADLRPLVQDPSYMDSAIDALERATVRHHQGKVRERGFVGDERGRGTKPRRVDVLSRDPRHVAVPMLQPFTRWGSAGVPAPEILQAQLVHTSTSSSSCRIRVSR